MDLELLRAEFAQDPAEALNERRQHIYNYLDNLDEGDKEIAEMIANELLSSGEPLTSTAVIIPVAAHQEARWIPSAISEYARQQPVAPFTLVLGLNCPIEKSGSNEVESTIAAVEEAKVANPELDVRTTKVLYEEPVIGEIRRDLWNGVAEASRQTGNFESYNDVIGINHDIDLVRLNSNCIAKIQQRYKKLDMQPIIRSVLPVYATKVKHAYSSDHPNISRAVLWSDFFHRQAGFGFEAGTVIPFSLYAKYGGINSAANKGEVLDLIDRQKHYLDPPILTGTNTETSARRYIARIDNNGFNVWTPNSFTAKDECREREDYPDITRERQIQIVDEYLSYYAGLLINSAAAKSDRMFWFEEGVRSKNFDSKEELNRQLIKYAENQVVKTGKLAGFVLERAIGYPYLTQKLEKAFEPIAVKETITKYFTAN